jgi:hypothetical protein
LKHQVTPDGRYFVVRGRLRRMANPGLDDTERLDRVGRPMAARRSVRDAKKPAWWDDGWPNFNQHMAKNTPYADWYAGLARFGHGGL